MASEMVMSPALIAIDAAAASAFTVGVCLMARPGLAARRGVALDEAAGYRHRIIGAMIVGLALFLGGFATASWVAAS